MRRTQREYLLTFGLTLIVGLCMAVVIWSTGTGRAESSDAFGFLQPDAQVAEDVTTTQDVTATERGSGSGHRTGRPRKAAATDIVASNPLSLAAPVEGTPNQVPEQTQTPSPEETTQPATFALDASRNYSTPAPGNVGGSYGGRRAPSSSGGSSGGYSPTGGRAKTTTEPAADAAPADSAAIAHVSGMRADTGGPTPVAGTSISGLAISSLTAPLAVPFDNLVPPAAVFAGSGSIPQLGESHGDPLAVLDPPDLGIEPSSFTDTPVQQPVVNPEPATLLLLGTGLAFIAQRLRRRGPRRSGMA